MEEALCHPYLEPYHDPEDEPTAPPIPEGFFDFDKRKNGLSKEQLKGRGYLVLMNLRAELIAILHTVLIYEELMR